MTRLTRLTERLNLKEFQLSALLEVTKAINNNEDKGELLKLYAEIMHGELGITRLMFFENDSQWRCVQALTDETDSPGPDAAAFTKDRRRHT